MLDIKKGDIIFTTKKVEFKISIASLNLLLHNIQCSGLIGYNFQIIYITPITSEFTKKRNQTSPAYNGEKTNDILVSLPDFLRELNLLIENLEELPGCYNSNPDIKK